VTLLYDAVIALWLLTEVVIGFRSLLAPRGRRGDRWSGPAIVIGVYLSVALGLGVARREPTFAILAGRSYVFAIGLIVALTGIVLRIYSVLTLGQFFTTRVQTTSEQTVVESGPYRLIRHPSYTGALLTILGVLMCSTNWISIACFVLAIPGFAYRIRVEERALMAGLGPPYADYMRRTKRLVPFVV